MKILLCVSGASGSVYADFFMRKTLENGHAELNIIFTSTAREVWEHEMGETWPELTARMEAEAAGAEDCSVHFIGNENFHHRYASGSNALDAVVILPCSMGTLGRIAQGLSADLIGRIADVQLKERRPLVIVPREAPCSLIHLRNMTALAEAGAIICPASPSFYCNPRNLNDLCRNFAERVMDVAGIKKLSGRDRWSSR